VQAFFLDLKIDCHAAEMPNR